MLVASAVAVTAAVVVFGCDQAYQLSRRYCCCLTVPKRYDKRYDKNYCFCMNKEIVAHIISYIETLGENYNLHETICSVKYLRPVSHIDGFSRLF